MVLVDSSVWINYFNGKDVWQTEILDQMLVQIPLFTGDLILTEVLQGFRKEKDYNKAKEVMSILACKLHLPPTSNHERAILKWNLPFHFVTITRAIVHHSHHNFFEHLFKPSTIILLTRGIGQRWGATRAP